MSKINSVAELKAFRENCKKELDSQAKKILVCAGTGCIAGGSLNIYNKLVELCEQRGLNIQVSLKNHVDHPVGAKKTGCNGFCELGPLVRIDPQGWLYTKVKVEDCEEIVEKSIMNGELIQRLVYVQNVDYAVQEQIPFYKKQTRIVFENCGHIDSEDVCEYIARGGYEALEKALFEMSGEEIVNEITESGLRGRGGGGFPAGKKWSQVARQTNFPKYVVCNGDEGDPGAFMDRSVMEGNPHSMIEGMIIAGVATGATEGYIYVRAEYPLAVARLQLAIQQAVELGLLGDNI